MYAISFLMYAGMMTAALLLHCFLYTPPIGTPIINLIVQFIDAGLTSIDCYKFRF